MLFRWDSYNDYSETFFAVLLGPPTLSLIFTAFFYQKSVNLLKNLPDSESKLTKFYIRNLQFYSFAQLFTFGPSLVYLFLSLVCDIDDNVLLSSILGMLANLSGFMNALIFFLQRREVYKKASLTPKSASAGELDSDFDTSLFNL